MTDRLTWCALVAVAVASLGGCGRSDPTVGGPRPVTDDEAARMAETLFANHDAGGADFALDAVMPDGVRISLSGAVDFVEHTGRASVRADGGPDARVTEVVWTPSEVFERVPELTDLARTLGTGLAEWYVRPPDVDERALDAMIAVVTSLASERRDNPLLIAQTEGTSWLRADTIPNTDIEVDVLRYGPRTVFWLEADDVLLFRFEGDNASGTRPVVIDLRDHGPRSIELPPADSVLPRLAIAELYDAVTTGPSP